MDFSLQTTHPLHYHCLYPVNTLKTCLRAHHLGDHAVLYGASVLRSTAVEPVSAHYCIACQREVIYRVEVHLTSLWNLTALMTEPVMQQTCISVRVSVDLNHNYRL